MRERIAVTGPEMARIPSLRRQILDDGECRICGMSYVPTLPEDRRLHSRFHAEYLRPRLPKPDLRLAGCLGDMRVDASSPSWLHALVYERARALQRDEHYDFPQWTKTAAPRMDNNERDLHALLLIEPEALPVGAVSFVWVDWEAAGCPVPPPGWHMNFVWIADIWRRKGLVTRRWPAWCAAYGNFTLEYPLSVAMMTFVRKIGHVIWKSPQAGGYLPGSNGKAVTV